MGNAELFFLAPQPGTLMMSCVIKTKNNKIVVVDGGFGAKEHGYYLHSAIRAILGLQENDYFEIDGWFLTHCHSDHFGEMSLQLERYTKESNFKVNKFVFDFPDVVNDMHYSDGDMDELYPKLEKLKEGLDRYANVNGIEIKGKNYYDDLNGSVVNAEKIKDGFQMKFDNLEIEFLQTYDKTDVTVNDTSLVFKITALDDHGNAGKTVMILGDMNKTAGKRLLNAVPPEKLRSDVVQMAHHGNWACEKAVYDAIGAEIRLWPTPIWVWNKVREDFDNDIVRSWFPTEKPSKTDVVACLYEEYPQNRERVEDWKACLSQMKIDL